MAKLDFPSSPTPSQKYPSPAVAGQPVYTWDGEKWTSIASQYVPGTAPFDAMAYSGMQINGGMEVSQERGAAALTTTGYFIDGFYLLIIGSSIAVAAQQVTDAPPGFRNSIKISVTTAKGSLAATDEVGFSQTIEGYRLVRLAFGTASAQSVSISFWCKVHRTGMYSASISNGAYNRTYAFAWTQNIADTWEYKTITIPGDTIGVWQTDNGSGMYVTFLMAGGTSTLTAPNIWTATGKDGATGQINGIAATSDTFQITGVTVLPGTQAPTAAQSPNIMRPYAQELQMCRRYFLITVGGYAAYGMTNGGYYGAAVNFDVVMRAAPTVTPISDNYVSGFNPLPGPNDITPNGFNAVAEAIAIGGRFSTNYKADARL